MVPVLFLELDRFVVSREWAQGRKKVEPTEYEHATGDGIIL